MLAPTRSNFSKVFPGKKGGARKVVDNGPWQKFDASNSTIRFTLEKNSEKRSARVFRGTIRGTSGQFLEILAAEVAGAVAWHEGVAGIRTRLPPSGAEIAGRDEAGQIRVSGEATPLPEEPERGLSLS